MFVMSAGMSAQPPIQINTKGLPEYRLNLVSAASSAIENASDPTVQLMWPYTVVLSNNTQRSLVAYSLSWNYVDGAGAVTSDMMRFVQIYQFMDRGRTRASRAGQSIAPSGKRLISPIFNISPSLPCDLSRLLGIASQLDAKLHKDQAITVTLDAAAFEDGTVVGPDTGNLFTRLSAEINAEQDLYRRIAASKSDADLAALIQPMDRPEPSEKVLGGKASYQDAYGYFHANAMSELALVHTRAGMSGIRRLIEAKCYEQAPKMKRP